MKWLKVMTVMLVCVVALPQVGLGYAGSSTKPPPDMDPDGWQTADGYFEDYLDVYWGGVPYCDCKVTTYYYGSTDIWASAGQCTETACYPVGCGGEAEEVDCP